MAKNNNKHDIKDILVRIMAAIMAILMVGAVAGTLIYYLMH